MTEREAIRAARVDLRQKAARDAAALRVVGLSVTIAAGAKRDWRGRWVPRLQQACRDAGFKT